MNIKCPHCNKEFEMSSVLDPSAMGKKGGEHMKHKSKAYLSKLGKMAALKRWSNSSSKS